jgi:hypothetical protein
MNKILYIILLVCPLLGLQSCDDDEDDSGSDETTSVTASEVFTGSFTISATGAEAAADFEGNTISFNVSGTEINYTLGENSSSMIVFPTQGSYSFGANSDFSDGNMVQLTRISDDLPTQATFSQKGQQLVLQFNISDSPNGKTQGVAGNYTLTLNK